MQIQKFSPTVSAAPARSLATARPVEVASEGDLAEIGNNDRHMWDYGASIAGVIGATLGLAAGCATGAVAGSVIGAYYGHPVIGTVVGLVACGIGGAALGSHLVMRSS